MASERDEEARGAFRQRLRSIDSARLVFIDESSTNIALVGRYGRAPRGQRALDRAPRNWGENVTLISSIYLGGMGPSMSLPGSADAEAFKLYLEHFLCPTLRPGQIVVMDNLSVHKNKKVRELIEECGCELLFLPPYSPDFNPIEEAFSKVKAVLKKARARSVETLVEATGQALSAVTEQDARGFFWHCGYTATRPHSL